MAERNVQAELEEMKKKMAEMEEMRKKMADVEEMRKKMAEMERKHREELLEVEQKRKEQGEMLLQMMENVTASNSQLTKMESEMQRIQLVAGSSKGKTTPEDGHPPRANKVVVVAHVNNSPSQLTQMTCFDLVVQNGSVQPDYVWQINKISKKLSNDSAKMKNMMKGSMKSNMFTLRNYLLQCRMKMTVNTNGSVLVSLSVEDTSLRLKTVPAVYYVLKDLKGSGKHRSRVIGYTVLAKFTSALPFQVTLTQKPWLTHHLYNVNDSVEVEVYVEPPAIAQQVHSYDGTLNWVIDNYARRRQMAQEELVLYQESPYFYTGPRGFRVRVRLWLNGYRDDSGVSRGLTAVVYFMTGEFDEALPPVFPHRTTVTLFNRREPQRSITKASDDNLRTSNFYAINMGEFRDVETLVHNDSIFYKVSVLPLGPLQSTFKN